MRRAPGREGWGEWDGQTDGHLSARPPPPTPTSTPLSLHVSSRPVPSLFLCFCRSLSFSLQTTAFWSPKRKMGKEDRDERKRRGTVCVCPARGLVGIFRRGGREETKGQRMSKETNGSAGPQPGRVRNTHMLHTPRTPHTHTLHTEEPQFLEGRSVKL